MTNTSSLIFKRERIVVLMCWVLLPALIMFSIWLAVDSFFFDNGDDVIQGRVFSLALLICSPMWLIALIYVADIHVDDDGIGWWLLGRRWRYIKWANVKKMTIKKITSWNFIPKEVTSYCLYTTDSNTWFNSQRQGMRFSDNMPNAERLVDAVNLKISQHCIPVIDNRKMNH